MADNAARVQGAGPNCTDGDPIQICPEPGAVFIVSGTVTVTPSGIFVVTGNHSPSDNAPNPTDCVEVVSNPELWSPELGAWWRAASTERFGGPRFALSVQAVVPHVCDLLGNVWSQASVGAIQDQGMGAQPISQYLPASVPYHHTGYSGVNPAIDGYSRVRTPFVFSSAQATAAGNTALWIPAAGRTFRLMRYLVTVTGDAEAALPGAVTLSLFDGGAGAIGQDHDFFLPATGTSIQVFGSQYSSGWIDLGNGILSSAANNVLNINLSAALTAGSVRVICAGTEE